MENIGRSLVTAFDFVWARFNERLTGLTDAEFFWAPAPDGWTVRQGPDGIWRLDGGGPTEPTPVPTPITTIAWRMGHIGGVLNGFAQRRFPPPKGDLAPAPPPHAAVSAITTLAASYRAWRDPMARLSNADWWSTLGPAWGPYSRDTTADLALHVLDEVVHHGAEIGLLRDLYAARVPGER